MPAIPVPITYPLIIGSRHSFVSIEAMIGATIVTGFTSIEYDRKRTRKMVYGNNPDPLGKTRGRNAYTCKCEVYLAEWNNIRAAFGLLGVGYGDFPFPIIVNHSELGLVTVTDVILGCTIDETTISVKEGEDATTVKFDCNPVKIRFGGDDDQLIPLIPLGI
jgi:hypothetical protein